MNAGHLQLSLDVGPDALEQIASRAAELVLERLEMVSNAPEFLSVPEAAELLRCKPQRIHELTSAGRLQRFKDGSRVLLRRSEILAHLGAGEALAERRRAA
jgi:excisionase family DNA binding protein